MNEIKKKRKKNAPKIGRPLAEINWKMVDDLLIAGCSGREVASSLGLNAATIYERCVTDKGMTFTEYSQQKSEKGESLIRAHQYAKALGLTDKGDNTLLIWLGKTRLKQMEAVPENKQGTEKENERHEVMMKRLDELQESARKMAEIKSKEDAKSA